MTAPAPDRGRFGGIIRRSVPGLLGAALAAGVATFFGLDAGHAVILACALFGVGSILGVLAWAGPSEPDESFAQDRAGSRPELSRLAWSLLEPKPHVQWGARRRLLLVAASMLAARGIDPADPAQRRRVDEVLGAANAAVLLAERQQRVSLTQFERTLAAVERLADPTDPPAPISAHHEETPHAG